VKKFSKNLQDPIMQCGQFFQAKLLFLITAWSNLHTNNLLIDNFAQNPFQAHDKPNSRNKCQDPILIQLSLEINPQCINCFTDG
jgi:hypothetical protein